MYSWHDQFLIIAPFFPPLLTAQTSTIDVHHDSAVTYVIAKSAIYAFCTPDEALWTDPQLLLRILGNMVKNALEGTAPGQTVRLSCARRDGNVVFTVHNPGVMPPEVQLQMFQRSFSTKSQAGRGIGTYSMKLLGERYLGGTVDFTSRAPDGTTFTLTLPPHLPQPTA